MEIKDKFVRSDFDEIEKLEKEYYDAEYVVNAEESYSWYEKFPFQHVAMMEEGRMVGFLEMFPVKKTLVEGYLAGTFSEQDISMEHMIDVYTEEPGKYAMLLCTVIVDRRYRGLGILKRLFEHMISFYDTFKSKEIEFDCIITDNVTEEGCRFSEKIGLKLQNKTIFDSWVYMGNYDEFVRSLAVKKIPVDEMNIRQIKANKKQYLDLLLLADEQEDKNLNQ